MLLSSDNEDEEEHTVLDIGKIKASLKHLYGYIAAMPDLELTELQQDLVHASMQDSDKIDIH